MFTDTRLVFASTATGSRLNPATHHGEASTRTGQCYQGDLPAGDVLERESRDARSTDRAAASQSKPRTLREQAGPKALVPGGVSEVTERAALLTDPLTAPNLPGLNQSG